MKRLIALLFVLSVYASAAGAQDFEKGVKAYDNGEHVVALEQLLPLAERGNTKAQFIVSLLYDGGKDVPQDEVVSMKWLKSAADLGLGEAQFDLARSYLFGGGVPQDKVMAYMWFNLASGAHIWLRTNPEDNNRPSARRAASARDVIAEDMSRAEIKEAQRRTREWLDAHPR